MKYVRIKFNGQPSWGELSHESVHLLDQAPYEGGQKTGKVLALSDCELLAPCQPSKIVAVGKNYHDHIKEFDAQVPERPILFIKPSTAIQDPGKPIVLPTQTLSSRVDYEGELALVIGKKASHVSVADATQYILGYTILNDVTARDLQKLDVRIAVGFYRRSTSSERLWPPRLLRPSGTFSSVSLNQTGSYTPPAQACPPPLR